MSLEIGNRSPGIVAGRYRTISPLGHGGASTVFAAVDLLTQREVALKYMRPVPGMELARVRLEIAILRRLQRPSLLPGVVRLLDDGVDESHAWLVMERIEGTPFPGVEGPCTWEHLRPLASSLLATLAELHGAGIVHGDLKPDNVLVDREGQPVIVDFGLSRSGESDERGITATREVRGTREYVAPERWTGELGPRCDLYSVGVMFHRALAGDRSRPLASLVPPRIAQECARLIAARPDERPASARDVLRVFAGEDVSPVHHASLGARAARWTLAELAERFVGPERLLHLPSDAAAVLMERTGGEPRAVEDEIRRWVRARLATAGGERVHVSRAALDALATSRTRRRETPRAWTLRAKRHLERGRHSLAEPLLRDALRASAAPPRDERTLEASARLWVLLVIAARDRSATARFLYELARIDPKTAAIRSIESLAHAFDAAIRWIPEAIERARAVGRFGDRELDACRWSVRVFAARKVSRDVLREEVEALQRASRSESESWERSRAVARGRLFYVEERYAQAAAEHEIAAERSPWRAMRLDALLNAASARMEAFQFARAMKLADAARREARGSRLAFFEGRAEWIWRTAADRAQLELSPDLELVEAARHLDAPDLVLLIAVTEATLAFRAGDRATFGSLAAIARDACGLDNEPLGTATIDAMEVALGIRPASARDLESADRLAARNVPRLALEVAALVEGTSPRSNERTELFLRFAASVPRRHWRHRVGVFGVGEALARLGIELLPLAAGASAKTRGGTDVVRKSRSTR